MGLRKKNNLKHLMVVFAATFVLACLVGIGAAALMQYTSMVVSWVLLLVIIVFGILFDIIGIAATAASEAPHHAKAANRVFGGKQAVNLVRNADKVANYANDIVGDVAGTLSGAFAASIIIEMVYYYPTLKTYEIWLNTIMLALVASLTVTGKAMGKTLAINEADEIIAAVGRLIATIEKITGWNFSNHKKKGGKRSGPTRKNPRT